LPKTLVKVDGSNITVEERLKRKRYVDKIRQQIIRGQLEGELENYVKEYDREHGFTIKEYKPMRRAVSQSVRKPIRELIRESVEPEIRYGEEEEESSFKMKLQKPKKVQLHKPESPFSPIIDYLFGITRRKEKEEWETI